MPGSARTSRTKGWRSGRARIPGWLPWLLLAAAAIAACGDDDAPAESGVESSGGDAGTGAVSSSGGPYSGEAAAAGVALGGSSSSSVAGEAMVEAGAPARAGASSGGAPDVGAGGASPGGTGGVAGQPPVVGGQGGQDMTGGAGGLGGHGGHLPQGEWIGVVGVGQSLSVGVRGVPVLSTTQPNQNLKLSLGAREGSWPIAFDDAELSLVPLVEPLRTLASKCCSSPYPNNIYGETYHTVMGRQLSWLHQRDLKSDVVSVHTEAGQSATGIAGIKKNGTSNAYAASLFEVQAIKRLADAAGATYRVGAVVLTHGEADANLVSYQNEIVQLQADYEQDLKAITGQAEPIPMLVSQQNVAMRDGRPLSSLAAWRAAQAFPEKIVCIGPKYQYAHSADHLHLTNSQYGRLGAKYAQVFHDVVVLEKGWQPLQPLHAVRKQEVVTVTFHVPVMPLAWDESLGPPHQLNHTAWALGRGFEVEDSAGEIEIKSVSIAGDAVQIVLARLPVTTPELPLYVRYAMTQDVYAWGGGLPTGRVGQLRDSDPFVDVRAEADDCLVTTGSTMVKRAGGGTFSDRSQRDAVRPVSGEGLSPTAHVTTVSADGTTLTLSEPWTAATGTARLEFRTNHWNHAIAFELAVPE